MKYKSIIILALTIFVLISIAGVSAADTNYTAIASEDTGEIDLSANNNGYNLQTIKENVKLELTDNVETVSVENDLNALSEDISTYSELSRELDSGGNIKLQHKNYIYDCGSTINIAIGDRVIDGNGAVIDMAGSNIQAFKVTALGVTIKNLTIKNANFESNGCAIYFSDYGTIINCNFTDNKATEDNSYGGAVYFNLDGNVVNCNFVNNSAGNGGAVRMSSGSVENCNFTDNSAASQGGAVHMDYYSNIVNCNFINNSAASQGGAINIQSGTVKDCNFTNNSAASQGGAVYISNSGTVSNCDYTNNYAASQAGAVYMIDGTVSNCNFTDNSAFEHGGAIIMKSGRVEYCNLTYNNASFGGAICFMGTLTGTVLNCNFTNNSAIMGGAVSFNHKGNMINSNFVNNSATSQGGAVYFLKEGTISNSNFVYSSASGDGGAVYFKSSGNVLKSNFTNNSASSGGAVYICDFGNVSNSNFTNNKATGDYCDGGAICFSRIGSGNVSNCNFVNNTAAYQGGAINIQSGTVKDCNFTNNSAKSGGAAIHFVMDAIVLINCNFTNNKLIDESSHGGAVLMGDGTVSNCNFIDNFACQDGGAIYMHIGNVKDCNFTHNSVFNHGGAIYLTSGCVEDCNFAYNNAGQGGAIRSSDPSSVKNCKFTDNTAYSQGGAIWMHSGSAEDCNFTGNNGTFGSAIFFYSYYGSKNVTNSCLLNNRANSEDDNPFEVTVNENNAEIIFMGNNNLLNAIYCRDSNAEVTFINVTYWGADGIANTGISPSTPSRTNRETGQNITVMGIVNGNKINSTKVTDAEGKIVLENVTGDYYLIFRHDKDSYYTQAETTSTNMKFYVNITSLSTNSKTVNITAKSNIYNEVIPGQLLFIIQNTNPITANYTCNGTWWALHTFDDYGEYNITASYSGLDGVIINNGTITVKLNDASVSVNNATLDLFVGDEFNLVATTVPEGLKVNFKTDDDNIIALDESGHITALAEGTALILVSVGDNITYKYDAVYVNVNVSKIPAEISAVYNDESKELTVSLVNNATGQPLKGASVIVKIGNTKYNVKINAAGQGILSTEDIAPGSYIATATYKGSAKYYAVNTTLDVVLMGYANISAAYDSDANEITVTLIDSTSGKALKGAYVAIKVGNTKYNVKIEANGEGKVSLANATPGSYVATATYKGGSKYYATNTTVDVAFMGNANISAAYDSDANEITVTLIDSTSGKALKGAYVTVKVGNTKYNVKIEANGEGKVSLANANPGSYVATATYKGGSKYYATNTTVDVAFMGNANISAIYDNDAKELVVNLVNSVSGKALKGATVAVNINTTKYNVKIDATGQGILSLADLAPGNYTANITYKGSTKYYPANTTAEIYNIDS